MAAVDGLFTRDFWNSCNQWDGHELFLNVDGDTYFLPASRPKGDYYGTEAAPFTLVSQSENAVELILTNRYWRPRGEDEAAWSQRTTSSCDYTVDYPIRYVNTADGWRLDEFHYGRTDQREYVLGHILWETEPRAALNGEMDAATLRQLGTQTLLDWGGTTYQIESDVNAATFTGRMYVLDVDGDGQTEASLVCLAGGDPIIAVYERTETGLQRRTFNTAQLAQSFDGYAQVERNDRGGITITHTAPRETTTIELSAQLAREGTERAVMQVLCHEVLHTCYGCSNHGARWKGYAQRMNSAYGYHIRRTDNYGALGIEDDRPVRYWVVCARCGRRIPRMKRSPLVDHPERYRCPCGGTLRVERSGDGLPENGRS